MYFPPAAPGPGKLLPKGLAPHQEILSLPMIVRKGRSYGQNTLTIDPDVAAQASTSKQEHVKPAR